MIGIPSDVTLWELVAAIQVCQSQGFDRANCDVSGDTSDLLYYARLAASVDKTTVELNTAKAYRDIDSAKESYQAVLARATGLPAKPIRPPAFPGFTGRVSAGGGIVVCAYEAMAAFKLPWQVWRPVVRHLRSYGRPVSCLGLSGERMDYASFTEGRILSNLNMEQKMQALASADLVVGVPNAWTWMATAWKKKILVLHPDDVPYERWFGFDVSPRTLGRLLYSSRQLQVPVILAGLRKLIEAM